MVAQGNVGLAFGLVIGAGFSSAVGAVLVFWIKNTNHKYLAASLGFSAGLMIYISMTEMLQNGSVTGFKDAGHSEGAAIRFSILCFLAGCFLAALLDQIFHLCAPGSDKSKPILAASKSWAALRRVASKSFPMKRRRIQDELPPVDTSEEEEHPQQNEIEVTKVQSPLPPPPQVDIEAPIQLSTTSSYSNISELQTTEAEKAQRQRTAKLGRMALFVAASMAIHNLFEGVAVFVGALREPKFGAAVAFAIALHNFPESVCIAFPIYFSTGSRTKAVLWTIIPSMFEPLGGLIAYLAISNDPSDLLFGITFGLIAGIMVFISIQELIPTAFGYDPENKVVTLSMLAGVFVMAASLMLLTL